MQVAAGIQVSSTPVVLGIAKQPATTGTPGTVETQEQKRRPATIQARACILVTVGKQADAKLLLTVKQKLQ